MSRPPPRAPRRTPPYAVVPTGSPGPPGPGCDQTIGPYAALFAPSNKPGSRRSCPRCREAAGCSPPGKRLLSRRSAHVRPRGQLVSWSAGQRGTGGGARRADRVRRERRDPQDRAYRGLPPGSKDLHAARERIADALTELASHAADRGVRLAIEPLHPMYAADRCVISTLTQALDLAERFLAHQVGITVDTSHLRWDDTASAQLARAGVQGRIHAVQLADWTTPLPEGALTGRAQLGDGTIDLRA